MTEDSQFVLDETTESMDNTIKHLEHEFQGIRAGKASPAMLNGVMVEYYGTTVPIEQTANIGCTDARMIVVQPFDKSALNNIAKAIMNANLGFNPINNGEILRISVPALTEERRRGSQGRHPWHPPQRQRRCQETRKRRDFRGRVETLTGRNPETYRQVHQED